MRTPGDDPELAAGFLFTEGILNHKADLAQVPFTFTAENQITINLKPEVMVQLDKLKRNFYTSSSCGVCGKDSIFAVYQACPVYTDNPDFTVSQQLITGLPATLQAVQRTFQSTGGIHAAALFDLSGKLIAMKEDVGRHNALDKLIGHIMLNTEMTFPLREKILLLSGRASFELVQKAAMAGIQMVCAVGAPSSLAVDTAKTFKITLTGFLKPASFNIYTEKQRIIYENQD